MNAFKLMKSSAIRHTSLAKFIMRQGTGRGIESTGAKVIKTSNRGSRKLPSL
jgi:hypothetical protein